jgi:NADH dehydrogenase
MSGRIFITGASGFVGTAVVKELLRRDYAVRALINRRRIEVDDPRIERVQVDLFDPSALAGAIAGCDAVIHLVGIIMEKPSAGITFERLHFGATKSVVDAASRAGVRRYVHMSALGTSPGAASRYHRSKYDAEQHVAGSSLDWTIIRPSMIHGPEGDFMKMEAMFARKRAPAPVFFMPVMPYFGGRRAGKLQPVYVGDVARAFVDAIANSRTMREIYPLSGPEVLTWPELHQTIAQAVVGRRRLVASMPVPIAKALAAVGVAPLLGFNRDQVLMSQEDNTADTSKFTADFGWEPRPFAATVGEYAREL